MHNAIPLLCCTVIAVTFLPVAAQADVEPDWRTIEVPKEIYVCESSELLKKLGLTKEQSTKLNAMLNQWKARFLAAKKEYDSQPEEKKRGVYGQFRDRDLSNTISDLLDDQQHQRFQQILTIWTQSPVQSYYVFKFEEKLSDDQHRRLMDLETEWVLFALPRVPDDYHHPRHQDRSRFNIGEQQGYRHAVTRLAWQFVPRRNLQWNHILRPEQATRWKERELNWAFQLYKFDLMLADFSVYREEDGQLHTGTWLDHVVPYFTPPFESLKWTEEQITAVQKLLPEVTAYEDLPKDRDERIRWLGKKQKRNLECMKQIEQIMTARQRATWWQAFGEPSPKWNMELRMMRAGSLLNRPEIPGKATSNEDTP